MTKEIVAELNERNFDSFAKEGLVFVDFYAEWCMPCMMMAPIIEDIAERFYGKIKFGKVDVSESEELARKFGVSSIPSMFLLKDGEVLENFVGSMPEEELEKVLKSYL